MRRRREVEGGAVSVRVAGLKAGGGQGGVTTLNERDDDFLIFFRHDE